MTAFNPFAWTRRQQALIDRTAAWTASGRLDAGLLTEAELADVESWLGASASTYPGIDKDVLEYLNRSREKLKTADDNSDDWQVIERRTYNRAGPVMALLARLLFQTPVTDGMAPSRVTWTVRNVRTGEIRKVTAASEKEFSERLAAQVFD